MGKKRRSNDSGDNMSEYERDRFKRLATNTARMEAAGHDGYLTKHLKGKFERVAKYVESATNLTMEDDWESEPLMTQNLSMVELMKLNSLERSKKVPTVPAQNLSIELASAKGSGGKEPKQLLPQTSAMVDFYKLQTQKQPSQDPPAQSQLKQRKNEQQHTKKSKLTASGQQAPKYITPGSLGAYNDMIKMRTNRQLNFNANEIELDNLLDKMPAVDTINTLNDVPSEEETSINQDEVVADQETSVENQTLVTAPAKKKNRGRSILADLHKRTAEKHIHIVLNDLHQPVGPSKKDVTDFIHFLGIVAKDPILTPPNVHSWKYVPTKEKIWEYVMTRFDVDEVAKKFVLTTVNDIWRSHKNRLKKAAYKFETKEERLANRPQNIPEIQYKELLDFWELDEIKEKSRKNSENVKNRVDYHTMGPFSYAMKKIEMEENHPNKKKPSQAELYIESRKRVPGRTYKTDPKQALQNIEKMKEKQSLPNTVDKGDPYYDVITKEEHSGRLRLYGRTVTKKTLKESVGNAPYVLPPKYMESIEKHLEQKITERILSQLKEANPGINIKITSEDDEVGGSNEASDSAANHSNQDHHQVDEE